MSVSILVARGFVAEVTRRGHDPAAFLASVGLERTRIDKLGAVLDLAELERVVSAATHLTGDPGIGLEAGAHTPPHALQLFGHLMLAQPTLRDVFATLMRYASLISDGVRWHLTEVGERAIFSCAFALGDGQLSRTLIDYSFALAAAIGRLFHDGEHAHEVRFRHARPPYAERYAQAFRSQVRFGQEHNAFVLSRKLVDRPQPHADPVARAMLRDSADTLERERAAAPGLKECVRVMLRNEPNLGAVSVVGTARALQLTPLVLRTKLRSEGTSFSTLLDDARRHSACSALLRREGSIQKAAAESGFHEVSAFFRAFKRWTGYTPHQFRQLEPAEQELLMTASPSRARSGAILT